MKREHNTTAAGTAKTATGRLFSITMLTRALLWLIMAVAFAGMIEMLHLAAETLANHPIGAASV